MVEQVFFTPRVSANGSPIGNFRRDRKTHTTPNRKNSCTHRTTTGAQRSNPPQTKEKYHRCTSARSVRGRVAQKQKHSTTSVRNATSYTRTYANGAPKPRVTNHPRCATSAQSDRISVSVSVVTGVSNGSQPIVVVAQTLVVCRSSNRHRTTDATFTHVTNVISSSGRCKQRSN
jgi:hypothetical protein